MRGAQLKFIGATALLAIALGAWSTTEVEQARAAAGRRSMAPLPTQPVARVDTTTTAVLTTTTVKLPKPPLPGLGRGDNGPDVLALEQRLDDLRYDVGKVDGKFDLAPPQAVVAFQTVPGMARTGRAPDDVVDVMSRVGTPGPLLPTAEPFRVEVDLKRQVLFLVQDGAIHRILTVSTGNGKRYCVEGECAYAVTPGGSFKITRRISGWRTSRLGKLYNPLYFNGGIAIHGAPSVPASPASHGCVRITMAAAQWFPRVVPNGTPVYVVGGPRAPVPFNEQAPGDKASTTTTTTTSTSSTTTTAVPVPTTSTTTSSTTTTTAPA